MTSVIVSTSAERRRKKWEGGKSGLVDFESKTRGSLFKESSVAKAYFQDPGF
jgi:hypothetical protein